jgi:hypothetical protein
MRTRRRVFASRLAIVLVEAARPAVEAYDPEVELFRFRDKRIAESSGVVASSMQDKVVFTHNDAGDTARFFSVDSFGCALVTFTLKGADAIDWEDMVRTIPAGRRCPSRHR